MRKLAILFLGVILLNGLLMAGVTFSLNTSTAPGFTDSTHTVVIRGSMNGWGGDSWALTNTGGDYWVYTSDTLEAGSYEYKYVGISGTGDQWESTDNRAITVTGDDALPLDFWESGTTPPYQETDDVDVWFRVSTEGIADYADQTMHIAGSMNGWTGAPLTRESEDSPYWSGQYSFSAGEEIQYKFLLGSDGWEGIDNRIAMANTDTTLAFAYFNNQPPSDIEPVFVTFRLNTSTAPGFTDSTHSIVIRGSMNGWGGNDWAMTNDGGDYWSFTSPSEMVMGDYEYKFVYIDAIGEEFWESTDNRTFSLSDETGDVVLDLDYWENGTTPPYDPTDEVDVWFRVSTQGIVTYAGATMFIAGSMNGWSGEPMVSEDEDGEFWSVQYSFPDTGSLNLEYKFLHGEDGWESNDNRTLTLTADTTVAFVYWDNQPPSSENPVTKTVIFSVDMSEWLDEEDATGMPVFSVSRGDQMQVRGGFNGWNCDNPDDCAMTRTPGTNIFSLAVSLTALPSSETEYKFFIELDSSSVEALEQVYGDMYSDMGWEDSPQFGGANRTFSLGEDDGTGLLELDMAGYYDLPATAVIPADQTVSVTFTVDMSTDSTFNANEDSVYVVLKDKWLNYLQGFGDNSTHVATMNGDGIYSANVDLTGPAPWHLIYTWGFHDVSENVSLEEGGGFGFGRFRARYMHADATNDCAWGDYSFPMDSWHLDPPLPIEDYDPESICIDFTGIDNETLPEDFYVSKNYPNPFNPTTSFEFGIPSDLDVKINIYNIMGQKVSEINKGLLSAGSYQVTWHGRTFTGKQVPSGIYFYEVQVGNKFNKIHKMTLLK